jgi:hypothetical protein
MCGGMKKILAVCLLTGPIFVGLAIDANAAEIKTYVDANFRGRHSVFTGPQPDLRGTGFDRNISSVIVGEGLWLACSEPQYGGNCLWFSYDVRNLTDVGFNDRVRSLRPEPGELFRDDWFGPPIPPSTALVLFEAENYGGHWRAIGSDLVDTSDFHPKLVARSAVVKNTIWRVCSERNFQGRCLVVTASVSNLQAIFALPIGSIQRVRN